MIVFSLLMGQQKHLCKGIAPDRIILILQILFSERVILKAGGVAFKKFAMPVKV